uniref:Calponin-homology (CH) domain-containing protein n=1 Tax=Poecilia mexicana TaxID=48701 RepID=A0A3B3XLZ0_9TELE
PLNVCFLFFNSNELCGWVSVHTLGNQNTFTRWINEHLKCVNKRIVDLQLDLGDGLRLIALLEVLSQKKMYRKYHPRPNFRQMKLENVSVALEFLERENIKLVSIGE